jgi:hypothetical protein
MGVIHVIQAEQQLQLQSQAHIKKTADALLSGKSNRDGDAGEEDWSGSGDVGHKEKGSPHRSRAKDSKWRMMTKVIMQQEKFFNVHFGVNLKSYRLPISLGNRSAKSVILYPLTTVAD